MAPLQGCEPLEITRQGEGYKAKGRKRSIAVAEPVIPSKEFVVALLTWLCYRMGRSLNGMEQCYGPLKPDTQLGKVVPQQEHRKLILSGTFLDLKLDYTAIGVHGIPHLSSFMWGSHHFWRSALGKSFYLPILLILKQLLYIMLNTCPE